MVENEITDLESAPEVTLYQVRAGRINSQPTLQDKSGFSAQDLPRQEYSRPPYSNRIRHLNKTTGLLMAGGTSIFMPDPVLMSVISVGFLSGLGAVLDRGIDRYLRKVYRQVEGLEGE